MSFTKKFGLWLTAVFLFSILSFSVKPVSAANTLYVSDNSGSDTVFGNPNNCQMNYAPPIPNLPCETVTHAIDEASSGDTILIEGSFTVRNKWIQKNITIKGSGYTTSHLKAHNLDRIFHVFPNYTLILEDVFLSEGFAWEGGAIYNQGTVHIIDGGLNDNRAQQKGGALYNAFGARAIFDSTEIGFNSADYEGGAVYNEGMVESMRYSYFHDNASPTLGGTFYNTDDGVLKLMETNAFFSSAENGAIIHNMGGYVSVIDSSLGSSTAVYLGGAIVNSFGTLVVSGSTFSYNDAHDGGAIYNTTVNDNSFVSIANSVFEGNTAVNNGGAIYDLSSDTVWTIDTTVFEENEAGSRGGALYLNGNATITIEGGKEEISRFVRNTAVDAGGAIFSKVNVRVSQTSFSYNDSINGGAIFNTDNATLHMERTGFYNNEATEDGGAIYDEATQDKIIGVNTTFSNNSAGVFGGAIYANGNQPISLANVTFSGNSGPFGGAIYTNVTVTLFNSIITNSLIGGDCVAGGGSFSGRRNLIDSHASGPCSGISMAAVTHIDSYTTGTPGVYAINGLSNAYDNGFNNCPDPLNGGAPLATDQLSNTRLGVNVPCDIGAYELH